MTEHKKKNNEEDVVRTPEVRSDFLVAQRALIYNKSLQKFCIATIARKDGTFAEKFGLRDIFGGHIDSGETVPQEAMMREIKEESGLDVTDLTPLRMIDFSGYGSPENRVKERFLLVYLGFTVDEEVTLSGEHDDYAWMSAEEISSDKEVGQWIKDLTIIALECLEEKESHEKMLRTLAEFDNYKKRSSEQQKDFAKYASEKVIMDMLPVLDNFHAATGFVPEDQKDSPWLTGIMYIQQQMEKVFEDAGVRPMEIAAGDVFDAQKMEAIKVQGDDPSANASDDDASGDHEKVQDQQKVSKIVQKGYMIQDRVMRVARVELG